MPFYDYHCKNCGQEIELMQKMSDPVVKICPNCHTDALEKRVSAPSIGSGGAGQGHVHGPGCRH